MESVALDAAGHRRSPATMPGYRRGRAPRNKGLRYPADPPTIEEIVAVIRAAGNKPDGIRLRALRVLLWRAGLRIGEALALIGSLPPLANSSGGPSRLQKCAAGSLPTSSATRTRSRWPTKASRSLSSSASSGTRTSGSPRSNCKHRQRRNHRHRSRTSGTDNQRDRRPEREVDHQAAGEHSTDRRPIRSAGDLRDSSVGRRWPALAARPHVADEKRGQPAPASHCPNRLACGDVGVVKWPRIACAAVPIGGDRAGVHVVALWPRGRRG